MTEEWAFVPGFGTDYEVSTQGRVRSYRRVNLYPNGQVCLMKPCKTGNYWYVHLSTERGKQSHLIHRLMYSAFVRIPKPGEMVRHWDDNPDNNTLSNLLIGSRSDNAQDSVRNGTHHMANKTHCPSGHEYTKENTRVKSSSRQKVNRVCRTCERDYDKKRRS